MIENEIELRILGILWEKLYSRFNKALEFGMLTSNEIILFCDYSSIDISKGHIFSYIKETDGTYSNAKILLKNITQEAAYPYGIILKGFKTICKFEFLEKKIPEPVKKLPIIGDWYGSNTYIVFGSISK